MDTPIQSRSWLRFFLLFLLGLLLLAALGWYWLSQSSWIVTWRPRMGETEASKILRFDEEASSPALLEKAPTESRPRNVILIIADGLGFSHIAAGRAQLAGLTSRLFVERLPFVGWQMTWADENLITDSAAAATAMATGFKVPSGAISQSSSGKDLSTVLERAAEKGMRAGLVTDSYLWDATPAAFIAHAASRRMRDEILSQMATSQAEILVGGGGGIDPSSEEGEALQRQFEASGWNVLWQWPSDPGTLLTRQTIALLPRDSIADADRAPQLNDLMDLATERLQGESGFFLMVETEEMDTASHRHNFERLVSGMAKLDETVRSAVEFAQADGETLVVVTSDHETGGLALISGRAGKKVGVAWATTSHSAEAVPIFAYGPGAERFAGALDNTDIARHIAELLELAMF